MSEKIKSEKINDEVLALKNIIESKLKIEHAIPLLPSLLPRDIYHNVVESFQQKYGSWYNYSSIYEYLMKKHSSPITEVLMFLFSGIGVVALYKAIEHCEKILACLDKFKGMLPNFKKVAYEQSLFIRKVFGKTRPCMYGIVGSDELRKRPEIAKALPDKYGNAEELQLDQFGLDLIATLVSNVLFGDVTKEEVTEDQEKAINKFTKANVYSSGGPVPNKITGRMLNEIKRKIDFDLKDGLYPLKIKGHSRPLKPCYDNGIYYTDYGVILWKETNPFNARYSALSTFGCHAYGTVAAARAITDFGSDRIRVDKDILKDMTNAIEKGMESFYVIVKARLGRINGDWNIKKIELEEGPIKV